MTHDAFRLLGRAQDDLRRAQVRLVEVRSMLAAVDLPDSSSFRCDSCRLVFRGPYALAEHRYHQHGDPEPKHWLEAEKLADPQHGRRVDNGTDDL